MAGTPARSHRCPAIPSALPTPLQPGAMPRHPQPGSRHGYHTRGPTPAPGMWSAGLCEGSEAAQQSLGRNHNVFDTQHAKPGCSRALGRPGVTPSQGSWGRLPCPEGLCIAQPRAATGLLGQECGPAVKWQVRLLGESLVLHPKQQWDSNPTRASPTPASPPLQTVEVPAAEPHPQPSPLCTAEMPMEG